MPNFQNKQPTIEDNSVIPKGNYSQLTPNTPIFEGNTGLKTNGGNFINCLLPADTDKSGGGNFAQIDYCAHLHPKMGLPEEDADCRHVVDTIELANKTIYTYENKINEAI